MGPGPGPLSPAGPGTRTALVRRPVPALADGLVTHIERSDHVDVERALDQWRGYLAALETAGFTLHEVDPAPEHPDSVFVEDALLVFGGRAVVTAPGARERQDEVNGARTAARSLGLEVVELVDQLDPSQAPGEPVHLDGGDVLTVGDTVYVGVGGRTTRAGAQALQAALAGTGCTVEVVPISRTLHLKSQVTALPDGTIVGYPPLVDDVHRWPTFLAVPEAEGAHVVCLGSGAVLMSDAAPRSADLFTARGLDVVTVPVGEFVKLEGCVTCLSVRLHEFD